MGNNEKTKNILTYEEEKMYNLKEVFKGISSRKSFAKTCECKGCGNTVSFLMSFSYATAVKNIFK